MSESGTPEAPIGPEPFVPEPCKRNVSISVKALGHVHEEPTPGVVGVGLIIYADETLRYDTLEAGDVDLIEYVPRQSFDAAEANPGPDAQDIRRPVRVPPPQRRRRPVRRPEGRQAVGYGIQRQDVIDAAFTGRGEPPTSVPNPPGSAIAAADPAREQTFDPEKAKAMLAKAGNLGGFSSERIDDLLDRGRAELHPEACRAIHRDLAKARLGEVPQVPRNGAGRPMRHGLRCRASNACRGSRRSRRPTPSETWPCAERAVLRILVSRVLAAVAMLVVVATIVFSLQRSFC